jgi:hypothetical protein
MIPQRVQTIRGPKDGTGTALAELVDVGAHLWWHNSR